MFEEKRRGHVIEISAPPTDPAALAAAEGSAEPVLKIDGEIVPYLHSADGYQIYFLPPAPTLEDAARSYVDTQREVSQ